MKLLKKEEAINAYNKAIEVVNSDEACEENQLMALARIYSAEASMEKAENPDADISFWEENYQETKDFEKLLRLARAEAEEAARAARKEVMLRHFGQLPESIKGRFDVEMSGSDWDFSVEY